MVTIHSVNIDEQTQDHQSTEDNVSMSSKDSELSDSTAEDDKENKSAEGEEEDENAGRMIDDEHDEVLENTWSVFFLYINKYMDGYKTILKIMIISLIMMCLHSVSEISYARWISSPEQNSAVYEYAAI